MNKILEYLNTCLTQSHRELDDTDDLGGLKMTLMTLMTFPHLFDTIHHVYEDYFYILHNSTIYY